jgi:nucleoside-diphosphate-sugar epimerase
MRYDGVNVLITGGLGFIGSNLAIRLVEEGAKVTIVDSLLAGCGGNEHNVAPVRDQLTILHFDIADAVMFREEIARSQVIFNLAGEISHIHSMQFPERDLQVNTVAQLRFLLECKHAARGVRVVFAGTRQIYGVPQYLPIDEAHPIQPVDFNGIHKYAATMYHSMLTRSGDIDGIVLRLTNVYGPRMALDVTCQGFLSNFLRKVMLKIPLDVFGDGKQLRDPVYVDDVVEAFLIAGLAPTLPSRSYNVGGREALSLSEIAQAMAMAGGGVEILFRPFPDDQRAIDIGSYRTDSRRIGRELGWEQKVDFADGLARTLEFYRRELPHYLDPNEPNPPCKMPEHSGAARRLMYSEIS